MNKGEAQGILSHNDGSFLFSYAYFVEIINWLLVCCVPTRCCYSFLSNKKHTSLLIYVLAFLFNAPNTRAVEGEGVWYFPIYAL